MALFWLIKLTLIVMVTSEAGWTEWSDLSLCTAKPCNCHPEKIENDCPWGKRIEIRFCNRTIDDPPCPYENNQGPIRQVKCQNNRENCPGWSAWQNLGCNCDKDGVWFGHRRRQRFCDNPKYTYKTVKCLIYRTAGGVGTLDGEKEMGWHNDTSCTCESTTTTVTTTKATTTITDLDCTTDYGGYGYGDGPATLDPLCAYVYVEQ